MFLLATILVATCACAPFGSQPCTQTGADANGTPLCPLSAAQVNALPEALVFYPGSTVVSSNAQGGALNVNGEPTSAEVRSDLITSAAPSEVRSWYDRNLRASGWNKMDLAQFQYIRYPPRSTYCELFGLLDILTTAPAAPQPAPGGSYYMVVFDVPSTAMQVAATPGASGNVPRMNPCAAARP
jgi:hypothetical protein